MIDALRLLADLEAAHAAATSGGWVVDGSTIRGAEVAVARLVYSDDAALIVAAVNALPALLAAVRAGLAEHDGYNCCDRTLESFEGLAPCPTAAAIIAPLAEQSATDEEETVPWCPHETGAFTCPIPCGCGCAPCRALEES